MFDVVSILKALHAVLTAAFVVATFALFGISLVNRLRIKSVLLSWRAIGWKRFPWPPLSFAVIIAAIQVLALLNGTTIPTLLLVGYGMGTLAWIGSSVLSNSIAVCECGIIGDIHSRNHAISWSQVTDYFEYIRCGVQGVVVLYRGRDGGNHAISWSQVTDNLEYSRGGVQGVLLLYGGRDGAQRRLYLPVPRHRRGAFMAHLSARFDANVEVPGAPALGKTALEG